MQILLLIPNIGKTGESCPIDNNLFIDYNASTSSLHSNPNHRFKRHVPSDFVGIDLWSIVSQPSFLEVAFLSEKTGNLFLGGFFYAKIQLRERSEKSSNLPCGCIRIAHYNSAHIYYKVEVKQNNTRRQLYVFVVRNLIRAYGECLDTKRR